MPQCPACRSVTQPTDTFCPTCGAAQRPVPTDYQRGKDMTQGAVDSVFNTMFLGLALLAGVVVFSIASVMVLPESWSPGIGLAIGIVVTIALYVVIHNWWDRNRPTT